MVSSVRQASTLRSLCWPGSLALVSALVILADAAAGRAQEAAAADPGGETAAQVWLGPEGRPVSFSSPEDLERFLTTAKIVEERKIEVGVTDPSKLLLEQDGRRLHAHFQPFDRVFDKIRLADGRVQFSYRDTYKFNIAAYRLSVLVGMDNIPPSFFRRVERQKGSVTVWLEGVITETDRQKYQKRPPSSVVWSREITRMRVFDELIANDDRNQGNILIDQDWRVWLIDHSRAFRHRSQLREPEKIRGCERRLWRKLQEIGDGQLREAVGDWLTTVELESLLRRRRRLVERIEELIAERGEESVLFDLG